MLVPVMTFDPFLSGESLEPFCDFRGESCLTNKDFDFKALYYYQKPYIFNLFVLLRADALTHVQKYTL